jgi:hypothetical protein
VNVIARCGLFLLVGLVSVCAAAPPAPGQLAADVNISSVLALHPAIEPAPVVPQVKVVQLDASRPDIGKRLWLASIAAMVAATDFDAATSWGKQEANPLLASPNGTFGPRGLAIKAGMAGALLVPQFWLHKHKPLQTGFTVANFADAAVFTGVSIHNLGVSR